MAARKTKRRKPRKPPARKRRRHPVITFGFMLLLSALLIWGLVAISQRSGGFGGVAGVETEPSHLEITDEDRRRLDEVLESIDDERARP